MIAFAGMLMGAAEKAGMKVPDDADEYDAAEFPHWHVYKTMQLGTAFSYPGCHWDNAKLIADISEDRIMKVTAADLLAVGFAARL